MIQTTLPRRVDRNISVEHVGQETLVYDEVSHRALCLNRTSSIVWNLCDGARTQAQIAAAATLQLAEPVTEDLVAFALEQLHSDGLLQTIPTPSRPVLTRRELVEKLGARTLLMLPVIAAVLVPEAAQALSGVVTGDEPSQSRSRARRSFAGRDSAAPKQNPASSDPYAP